MIWPPILVRPAPGHVGDRSAHRGPLAFVCHVLTLACITFGGYGTVSSWARLLDRLKLLRQIKP
jgi:hypothetical protein